MDHARDESVAGDGLPLHRPLQFRRWLRRLAWRLAREWRLRQQVTFLMRQDERMLRDLGLCRTDVARTVRRGRRD